jgi:hypothetical protein
MSCSTEVVVLSLADAELELVSVNAGISALYTSIAAGGGVTKMTVGSREFSRTYEFASPESLLKALQERAAYLRNYIASFNLTACDVPKFNTFSNIPMIFRRNQ